LKSKLQFGSIKLGGQLEIGEKKNAYWKRTQGI
jgi:hypothetical protein